MKTIVFQETPGASVEKLNALLRDAFAERVACGMNFAAANHTREQLASYLENKTTFVICNENGDYIATISYSLSTDKNGRRYGELFHLAVSPSSRRKGEALQLFCLCLDACRKEGAEYVRSHTAIHAESSVRLHLKAGLEIRRMFYNGGGGYYSYLFIKEFSPLGSIARIWNKLGYIKSIFTCRIRKMIFKLKH